MTREHKGKRRHIWRKTHLNPSHPNLLLRQLSASSLIAMHFVRIALMPWNPQRAAGFGWEFGWAADVYAGTLVVHIGLSGDTTTTSFGSAQTLEPFIRLPTLRREYTGRGILEI